MNFTQAVISGIGAKSEPSHWSDFGAALLIFLAIGLIGGAEFLLGEVLRRATSRVLRRIRIEFNRANSKDGED